MIGYYSALASVGLMAGSLGPTLPGLAAHTQTTLQGISLVFIARPLGYMAGALLTGRLLDRLPGHPTLALAAVFCSLTLFLTPLMTSLTALALVMVLMGFAESGLDVGGNTLLGWVYGDKVGPYMNGLHFFFGVGSIIAPLVVAQALRFTGGITWAYWVLALLMLPVAAWLWRLPSPPHLNSHREAKAPKTNGLLLSLFVLFFLFYSGMEAGYGNWVFSYAKALGLADAVKAAYLTSIFWGALTFGRLVGIPIAARFRPVQILAVDITGCALSLGVVMIWPGVSWVLWVGTAGVGFSMASIFPTLMAFAGKSLSLTGKITSLFFIGVSLGVIIFPWLIGQGFETVGPKVVTEVILADIALLAAVYTGVSLTASKASKR